MGPYDPGNGVGDAAFLAAFESQAISKDEWTHAAHIRMGYLYARAHPLLEATAIARRGIQALNLSNGLPHAYHETLTIAWMRVIAGTIAQHGPEEHAYAFFQSHPELTTGKYMYVHYTPDRLWSAEARAGFIPPDCAPLPPE